MKDKAQAAVCSIVSTRLVCDTKTIGINPRAGSFSTIDMGPIDFANLSLTPKPITDGFSLDASGKLHFKNVEGFKLLNKLAPTNIDKLQGGEAEFGLYNSALFFQLGCPSGTHYGFHAMVQVGTARAVPL